MDRVSIRARKRGIIDIIVVSFLGLGIVASFFGISQYVMGTRDLIDCHLSEYATDEICNELKRSVNSEYISVIHLDKRTMQLRKAYHPMIVKVKEKGRIKINYNNELKKYKVKVFKE